jgi:ribosomal-protein-serine acetyltransferase
MLSLTVDDRTTLTSVAEKNADEVFALVDANRGYLRRWLPWLDSQRTPSDTRAFIRESIAGERRGRSLVVRIDHDGELCGMSGFNWIDPVNRCCEIGYWLRADRQGRGIVTACCRALIRHAFLTLNLNRVNIPVAVGNERSRAIPEHLGFHHDGTLREGQWLYDHYVDLALYSLLRRDYGSSADRGTTSSP